MKYESKQQIIYRSAEDIFTVVSKFSNFTPILQDKVDGWHADDDTCSFKAQGFSIGLKIEERRSPDLIKIVSSVSPVPFAFWLQLKPIGPSDTRMRVVMDVELTMMLKMMVGSKLQGAVDKIAEQIATGLNQK